MWHQLVGKPQIKYEDPVLKPKEEATCITNTSFVLFPGIYYLLKALLQVILMLKNSRKNSTFKVPPGLHRSRNLYGNTIIKTWYSFCRVKKENRKCTKVCKECSYTVNLWSSLLQNKTKLMGIAMNIMSIGICFLYNALNTSTLATLYCLSTEAPLYHCATSFCLSWTPG